MNRDFIKRDYTKEQVIQILLSLGSDSYKNGPNGEMIFQTVCHNAANGSYKLYYYPESRLFHCYTGCGESFDIYDLVSKARAYTFYESFSYISRLLGIGSQKRIGFQARHRLTDDWEIIHRYASAKKKRSRQGIPILPEELINYYCQVDPVEWEAEGICRSTLEKYQIRYDLTSNKIVIPHFNADGQLIGIRGRALNTIDIEQGKKYMPMVLENSVFRHPTAFNLYGLYQNKAAICMSKKIMLFEAEKSVLKCDGYYGGSNFAAACCGSSISRCQRDTILNLGVKEVFLAFDKEYHEAFTEESDAYSEKILALAYKFCPYVTTYVLWDTEGLLGYQDSPCDRGKDVLERLMEQKFEVLTQEG